MIGVPVCSSCVLQLDRQKLLILYLRVPVFQCSSIRAYM
jgi:hypothetical protein